MKLDDFELLVKLDEVGTIRGTAKHVLISQPAVTQRLHYIENYYDVQIFIRTSKKLLPTPSGELIIDHAREMLETEKQMKNQLASSMEDIQGTLSIACSSLISQRFLPKILGDYTTKFPKVSIDLDTGISEDIRRNHKKYHVSIIRGEKLKETVSIRLFEDPLYMFDTEEFPVSGIKTRPLIAFKSDDSMNELVENWLYYHQDSLKPQKTITVDQIETCKQFMKQGIGMAVLPKSVSTSMMDEYPHISLQLKGKQITRDTWVCFQEGVRNLPQVSEFIDLLTENEYLSANEV